MILKPYPEYKDSGVPWLGKIPKHWYVHRNGRLFAQRNQTGFAGLPILEVSLNTGVRVRDFENSIRKQVMTDRDKYKRAVKGDLAYNMMRMWQGAVGVAPVDGLVSPAYVVAYPFPETEARYFNYLFHTNVYMNEVDKYSRGIVKDRNRLYWDEFKQMPSAFPPPDEQKAIADFLDWNARITRRLVSAKRRLIELLNEQKQVIIHRAVTRGLAPNVRLKPSGIAWLGDVPEHWEIVRLGRLIQLTTGFPFSSQGFSLHEGDTRLLRGINVSPGMIRWDSVVRWPSSQIDAFSGFALRVGDIVLGMDRPTVGGGIRVAVIQEQDIPSLLLQRVARLRPLEPLDKSYMVLLISGRGFSDYLAPIFTGISVPHISPEQIRSFRVALPPLEEQAAIVAWIRSRTDTIEQAINGARHEIDLLRAYRTRLIADMVTGKLDVRGVELPTLDNVETLEDWETDEDAQTDEIDEMEGVDV